MTSVREHYETLLARHYSWMLGDFDARVREQRDFFDQHRLRPRGSGRAIDLGCGPGVQSLALADLGFSVVAIDLSPTLLRELGAHAGGRRIQAVEDDLLNFPAHCLAGPVELIVCMGDTLTHLESPAAVRGLFRAVREHLEPGGRFVLGYRDLTTELRGVDRIVPVRSDESTVMTVFLEYAPEHVVVHDVVYTRADSGWECGKGSYRKLRLGADWVRSELETLGFAVEVARPPSGLTSVVAVLRAPGETPGRPAGLSPADWAAPGTDAGEPAPIGGLAGVLLWTEAARFPAMLRFYRDTLGLVPRTVKPDFANFDWGGVRLSVGVHGHVRGPSRDPLRVMVNFAVADIHAVHARLAAAGVAFSRRPEREPWGGWVATFADPDGTTLQLLELPPERGPGRAPDGERAGPRSPSGL